MKTRFSHRFFIKDISLLLICLLIGGCLSLVAGQDISSETISHSLYLPFALLNGSLSTDIAAAGPIYSFQNPFLYLPYYMLFKGLNAWPKLSTFLQGIPAGLFFFFTWKICLYAFLPFKRNKNFFFYLAVFLASISGLATWNQIGRSNGQLYLAALYLLILYLWLRNRYSLKTVCTTFFLAGFSFSLSPSALPFGLGFGAAALFQKHKEASFKTFSSCLLFFILGSACWPLAAFLLHLDMAEVYRALWPTGWAWASTVNLQEVPMYWQEWLLLPWERLHYFLPQYSVDARLWLGLLSAVTLLADYVLRKAKTTWRNNNLFWAVFFLATYAGWLFTTRENNSSVILEFASIILLARLLLTYLKPISAHVFMWGIFLLLFCQPPLDTARQGIEKQNFYFHTAPSISQNAFMVTAGPVAGLIPFFPQKPVQTAQIWLDHQDYPVQSQRKLSRFNDRPAGYYTHHFDPQIQQALAAHQGPVYLLAPTTDLWQEENVWKKYHLKAPANATACLPLFNNNNRTAQKGFILCPLKKTLPHNND